MVRGDPVVKEAIEVGLRREESWSRKSSTIFQCREIFREVEEICMIPSPTNTYNFEAASRLALPNLKKQTNKIVSQIFMEKYNKQAEETSFQGEFFTLLSG